MARPGGATTAARLAPRRVLLLKPCCLGDLVQITALVAAIAQRWPAAAITVGTGRWSRPAVERHPAVGDILDTGNVGIRGRQRPSEVIRLAQRVRRRRFDLVVAPDRSPVLSLLTWLAAIPARAGLDSGGRGRWYTIRVAPLARAHELEQFGRLAAALGIAELPLPRFYPGAAARAEADALRRDLCWPPRLAVIAPGGGDNPGARMPDKRWSVDGFGALARFLDGRGATVVIAGGSTDRLVAAAVAQQAPAAHNLAGRASIETLGALLAGANLFAGNDSGTAHLAAACGCPTVAIFGPTAPELYAPRGRWVRTPAPDARLRRGGDGSVRSPYAYAQPWQVAVTLDAVCSAAEGGLRAGRAGEA